MKTGDVDSGTTTLLQRTESIDFYLFTDELPEFYRKIGFIEQPIGLGQVVGKWLVNE